MSRNYFLNKKNRINFTPGFSLIELLVSVSIIVLVMGVVIARQDSYNGSVLLRSQAYEVALQIRDIQLSAVSAIGSAGQFRDVVGLYFSTIGDEGERYLTFRDADGDFFYTSGEEFGKANNLDKRFEINEIRLIEGSVRTVDDVSVVFERPNFDALFYTDSDEPSSASAIEIDVRLKGTTGNEVSEVRTVEITRTGQITVQ